MGNCATYALVEAGTVRFAYDYWGGHSAPADVVAGPAALPPEDQADEGAYLDVPARSLWVWERRTLDPRNLEGLRRRWPGWQVRGHIEGLVRQVALSGRDPGTVPGLVVPRRGRTRSCARS